MDTANTATGSNVTVTERTALRAEEIRLIPDGQALVIYRNAPAMLVVTLTPWTHRPDGAHRRDHPGKPAEPSSVGEDRIALVWNGLQEVTTRLDGTEGAVALDTLTAAVADLKTQLAQLLAKEREKDVPPRRWADRATLGD